MLSALYLVLYCSFLIRIVSYVLFASPAVHVED